MKYVLMLAILDLLHGCYLIGCVVRRPERNTGPNTGESAQFKKIMGEGVGERHNATQSAFRRPRLILANLSPSF